MVESEQFKNETGTIVGRLKISEIMYLIRDSQEPTMRYTLSEWLLTLSQFLHESRGNIEKYNNALVISLPLTKKQKGTRYTVK